MKHALLVLPLVLLSFASLGAPRGPSAQRELARVREDLAAVHAQWDAARTSHDAAAFERMLAPDFWVEIGPTKLTRAQFIDEISRKRPGARLARFQSEALTLSAEKPEAGAAGGVWVAVVEEKLEVEGTAADGQKQTSYSLWITKDRFRKDGERWVFLSSQAIGWESWGGGERPPFADWGS